MARLRERAQHDGAGGPAEGGARAFVTRDALMRLRHRARGFSFLPRQPVHSLLSGRHASRLRGRGLNFEELRHYSEGDDTRTIDWLATARLGTPHVRVYSEERDRPVLLVTDQRSAMFFGSRRAMKSVVAAEAAALAAWRVTALGDRVGAIVFGDRDMVSVRPEARDDGAVRVIAEVARQNGTLAAGAPLPGAEGQLNEALRRAERMATHDWLVCLITDAAGEDAETARLVTRLTAHNDVLAIHIHDPLERDLPDVGRAIFSSGEAQIEVDSSSASLRRRYAEERAAWRARLTGLSRRRAIPVLGLSTDRDAASQLRELIGKRTERRATSASGARDG
ncbi:DUF58 domain-containing protein [Methylobacterium durans]|uniref:DUF58 domain-containing protein n=1 Tax=Methylobacterium durans TaxID=2202825 RepID=UPI002AFDF03B|nr:DUF58 domain-containing protein [Methylobacterium durans]MEA1834324.1 DUF58 domain-containing protein [Methylobacterium durans]